MKRNLLFFALISLLLFFSACVTPGFKTQKANTKLANQYLTTGQQLEKQGDLPAALEQYKLALTVDPKNSSARSNQERLSKKLSKLADERYNLGMKYYSQGKYGLARKEFLTALKYQPDHPKAAKMLVSREHNKMPKYTFHIIKPGESLSLIAKHYYGDVKKFDVIARFNKLEDATKVKPGQRIMIPEIEGMALPPSAPGPEKNDQSYVTHILQPGESISKLAQMYYGDYKQFHIIAQFNGLDDATRVSVGQKIKIPEIAGLPFHTEHPLPAAGSAPAEEPEPKTSTEQTSEMQMKENANEASAAEQQSNEQVLAYRDLGIELFNESKYEDAILELNKAIEASPKDSQTRTYLSKAYFEAGKQLFDQKDYKAAQESFESARQFDPACAQCQAYIEKSQLGPLLAHRSKGMELFNNNKYSAAIVEFEQFLQDRPEDKEIRTYLSKAYFQKALIDYNKGEFLSAKKGFESALGYDSACEKCNDYIKQSLGSYKETHYNKGIVFFGKEQLPQAIAEWELVHELDPNYKDVDQNLKKAKVLWKKLEKIKKSQQ